MENTLILLDGFTQNLYGYWYEVFHLTFLVDH